MNHCTRILVTGALAFVFCAHSFADVSFSSYSKYAGIGGSYLEVSDYCTSDWTSCDDTTNAVRLFAGLKFGSSLALEAGYYQASEVSRGSSYIGSGGRTEREDQETSTEGYYVAGLWHIPTSERASFFAKIGFHVVDFEWKFVDVFEVSAGEFSTDRDTVSFDEEDLFAGIGWQFASSENIFVRLEGEYFDLGNLDGKFKMLTASVAYSF